MQYINLELSIKEVSLVQPKLMGGSPPMGLKIKVINADPDEILEQLFEWFGKEKLIEFIKG